MGIKRQPPKFNSIFTSRMSVSKNGYWNGVEAVNQHCFDASLCVGLEEFFRKEDAKSVVDLGCGMGSYVKTLRGKGIAIDGFDGNPATPQLSGGACGILDLSVLHKFEKPYDWVMSLEVGEHLPKEFEDVFVDNLHANNVKGIVLSWAVKGQGGCGHVNEQNNDYIKEKVCSLGYLNDVCAENKLRRASSLWWFKNTIMVFRRS